MMRFLRLLAWSFITATLVIAALGGTGYWLYREAEAPGPLAEARTLVVPPHTGTSGIAALLADEGVIRHPLVFQVMARLSGRATALHSARGAATSGLSDRLSAFTRRGRRRRELVLAGFQCPTG